MAIIRLPDELVTPVRGEVSCNKWCARVIGGFLSAARVPLWRANRLLVLWAIAGAQYQQILSRSAW